MFSGRCQNTLISFSLGGHTSARGLPARMAGADRMTCVIYQTRGARPEEKNRPPRDKAPRELSSTRSEGSVSRDRHWQICGDRTHMDTRWHRHTSRGNTHREALPAQIQNPGDHALYVERKKSLKKRQFNWSKKKRKEKKRIWIFNILALQLQTHIPTHTPTYMFPLAAREAAAKASPVASSRPDCVPVPLNERSLAAERNSLTWQRRSISFPFISMPPHTHNIPLFFLHYVALLFIPSSILFLLPLSLSLSLAVVIPLPPPFTLSIACSFVFISLIYFLCQMQADSHQSLSHTHTHTLTHAHLTSRHAGKHADVYAQMHTAPFSLFIHLLSLLNTHTRTQAVLPHTALRSALQSHTLCFTPVLHPLQPPKPSPLTLLKMDASS